MPVIAAFNNHVFGLHPHTGARLWRFDFVKMQIGGGLVVRIAVAGEMVYAVAHNTLACIHGPTGQVIGQVAVPDLGYAFTLLATEDLLLIATDQGTLQCYSRTGQFLWRDGFPGEGFSPVALAYGGQVVQGDRS
jgi:outer membrane protein assembly factor BamB